jgi:hypothetical protein
VLDWFALLGEIATETNKLREEAQAREGRTQGRLPEGEGLPGEAHRVRDQPAPSPTRAADVELPWKDFNAVYGAQYEAAQAK